MCEIKKNIYINDLFKNLSEEFIYVYKNIRKLEFNEEPDYNLYIILFENILRKTKAIGNKSIQFCFYKKINNFLKNNILLQKKI